MNQQEKTDLSKMIRWAVKKMYAEHPRMTISKREIRNVAGRAFDFMVDVDELLPIDEKRFTIQTDNSD